MAGEYIGMRENRAFTKEDHLEMPLATCVSIVFFNRDTQTGHVSHCLDESDIVKYIEAVKRYYKNQRNIVVHLYGGKKSLGGDKNVLRAKSILRDEGFVITKELTGQDKSMFLEIKSGAVKTRFSRGLKNAMKEMMENDKEVKRALQEIKNKSMNRLLRNQGHERAA